jgi:hypothetical protein
MSALVLKNEPVAGARSVEITVFDPSLATGADPGTDLDGYLYVSQSGPTYALALGTWVNKRRPLPGEVIPFTCDHTTNTLTAVGHGLQTGDGAATVTATVAPPAPLIVATSYWVIVVDDDSFMLAASLADAYAGTEIDLTTDGTGTFTLVITTSTERGIPGKFQYTFTQLETSADVAELTVAVMGHATLEGGASVTLERSGSALLDEVLESGHTVGDALRLMLRECAAKFSITGSVIQFRDIADTKDSHHGTVTASGRTDAGIDDAT